MMRKLAILLFCVVSLPMLAQFSPGDLSSAHAHLEGLDNCTKCHDIGSEISESKCLDCHDEISSLIDANRGYHSSREVKSKTCIDCHSEHHGRRFDAVRFDADNFNHNLTGYELEGAHRAVECRECHQSGNIASAELRKRNDTYLGLGESCLSCHSNYHRGTLPVSCTDCHTMDAWEPASGFNHAETDFPLRGAHQQVACVDCHEKSTRNGETFQEFAGVSFSTCTDCHTDIHEGRFGTRCTDCHTERSWHQLKSTNRFIHNATDFPLEGLHANVTCAECHTTGSYRNEVAHAKCTDCHSDYHEGDFAQSDGSAEDCSSCHTVQRPFTYTSYGLEEHQESHYPLEGAHLATPCFACHQSDNEKWEFAWESTSCISCHDNIHEGYISDSYYPENDCESCHNPEQWAAVEFDHNQTNWTLEGAHSNVSCATCHWESGPSRTVESQVFRGLSTDCASCHDNPHGQQFEKSGITQCTDCHSLGNAWNISNFDHSTTDFPLTGKHANVTCDECHFSEVQENGDERVVYKIPRFECIDCHGS